MKISKSLIKSILIKIILNRIKPGINIEIIKILCIYNFVILNRNYIRHNKIYQLINAFSCHISLTFNHKSMESTKNWKFLIPEYHMEVNTTHINLNKIITSKLKCMYTYICTNNLAERIYRVSHIYFYIFLFYSKKEKKRKII